MPNASATQHPEVHIDGTISATSKAIVKQLNSHIAQILVDPSSKSTALPTTTIKCV